MSYQRPIAIMNDDLAEGVYVASGFGPGYDEAGESSAAAISSDAEFTIVSSNIWPGGGSVTFRVSVAGHENQHIRATMTMNKTLTAAYGGFSGGLDQADASKIVAETWSATSSIEVTVQGQDLDGLDLVSLEIQVVE